MDGLKLNQWKPQILEYVDLFLINVRRVVFKMLIEIS